MRLLILQLTVMLCGSMLLAGCDRAMEQPIKEIVIHPQSFIDKAKEAMESVNERRTAVQQKAEKTGDFSNILTVSEDIFQEELGFRKGFWVNLVEIYRQENLENTAQLEGLESLESALAEKVQDNTIGMFYFTYISAFDALIVEYLRLSFEFPEKSEEELLMLFRESMRNGEFSIVFP